MQQKKPPKLGKQGGEGVTQAPEGKVRQVKSQQPAKRASKGVDFSKSTQTSDGQSKPLKPASEDDKFPKKHLGKEAVMRDGDVMWKDHIPQSKKMRARWQQVEGYEERERSEEKSEDKKERKKDVKEVKETPDTSIERGVAKEVKKTLNTSIVKEGTKEVEKNHDTSIKEMEEYDAEEMGEWMVGDPNKPGVTWKVKGSLKKVDDFLQAVGTEEVSVNDKKLAGVNISRVENIEPEEVLATSIAPEALGRADSASPDPSVCTDEKAAGEAKGDLMNESAQCDRSNETSVKDGLRFPNTKRSKDVVLVAAVSPTSVSVPIKIYGEKYDFLLDTGASKTLMDYTTYLKMKHVKPLNKTKIKFQVANGEIMESLGVIHLPLDLNDGLISIKKTWEVYICKKLPTSCIFGFELLDELGFRFDPTTCSADCLRTKETRSLNLIPGEATRTDTYQAKCMERVVVPPMNYVGVEVGTRNSMPPKEWRHRVLCDWKEELDTRHGIFIVGGVMDFTKGPGVVCLINPTTKRIILPKDTVIADLCEAIEGDECVPIDLRSDVVKLLSAKVTKKGTEETPKSLKYANAYAYSVVAGDDWPKEQMEEVRKMFSAIDPALTKCDMGDDGTFEDVNYPDYHLGDKPSIKQVTATVQEMIDRSKEGLTVWQQKLMSQLVEEMLDTFMDPSEPLKGTSSVAHYIETGQTRPIRQAPRRVPPAYKEMIEEEVRKMLEAGVIRKSNSPWSSPVVLVEKKDGSIRFCIDYRKLNNVTRKNAYPLPRIDDNLEALKGKKWFCTLDLASGYWQVKMHEGDKEKTAFASHMGLYEFNYMPFGLTNAPATFQAMMEDVLDGLIGPSCLLYLDDVIVFGDTFETCLENLRMVMGRLRAVNLKLKAKKCDLFRSSVAFLGHVVSESGVSCDPKKVEAIQQWEIPACAKDVRSILGLGNYYRRFIRDYAHITAPLTQLTHKDKEFVWTVECEKAFRTLQKCFCSAPILAYPDVSEDAKPFLVDTDASDYQIGGVLQQEQQGDMRVIMYASKGLVGSQKNWCTTRRELWAMVHMVTEVFKHYLLGRDFTLRTDHAALKWVQKFADKAPPAVNRWLLNLEPYNAYMDVQYRKGEIH